MLMKDECGENCHEYHLEGDMVFRIEKGHAVDCQATNESMKAVLSKGIRSSIFSPMPA
jgi:hypothetical protein